MQRSIVVALLLPLMLAGCISFSSSDPNPPNKTPVVVPPPGSSVYCSPAPC
ncbi:hypothetical protein AB4Z48_01450 [Cupriavidus sp. 2TAF22]|uniref:hypothetical protein n=1 Tax=unclassified Cupriavidus TaxID=2640874 RepID=UPI003F906DD2